MDTFTINLSLHKETPSYVFDKSKFISFFPGSLINTILDVTGENIIDMTMPFVTPTVMDILQSIIDYGSIPNFFLDTPIGFDLNIQSNLIKSGNYLNIDLLVMIGDEKWKDFVAGDWGISDINILDPADIEADGSWLFKCAIEYNYELLVSHLINYGVDPTQVLKIGDESIDAITYASREGYLSIVKRLLKDERVTLHGSKCIGLASRYGETEVVQLLLRHTTSIHKNMALVEASEHGHLDIVEMLLQDSEVDPTYDNNQSIQMACLYYRYDIVDRLMDDPRVDPSVDHNTILRLAIYNNEFHLIERLLHDPRVIKEGLEDAIGIATKHGEINILELLHKL